MYERITAKLTGIAPLIMHNVQLADPMNETTRKMKAITNKGRKKSDADIEELARLEFMAGLYVDEKGRPCVPGANIEGMLREAAKKQRKGKDFGAGVICEGEYPLEYEGPKKAEKLWESGNFRDARAVVVKQSRIIRTRAAFRMWAVTVEVQYRPDVVSRADVVKALETGGSLVGLMDYRPRYGRFEVKVL